MQRFNPLLVLCVLPLAMAQCASAPMSAIAVPDLTETVAEPEHDPLFRKGLAALRTGAERDDGWMWPAEDSGEWVLLGLSLTDARRRNEDVWFIRLSTPPTSTAAIKGNDDEPAAETTPHLQQFRVPAAMGPYKRGERVTAPSITMLIESFDRHGNPLQKQRRFMPMLDDGAGLESLGRSLAEGNARQVDDDSALGTVKLMTAMHTISRSEPIKPIRDQARRVVIREPNIFSLILNAFRINVRADFNDAEQLEEPWLRLPRLLPDMPQYLASSPLYVAGQHVLNCQVILGPMHGPFALTAGLLGMEISHPANPQNKLTVKVLATKPEGD